jgi:hypothetical protein
MRPAPLPSSYRDPSGFVFRHDGTLYRHVAPSYAPHYDALLASGLYRELVGANLLIPHREMSDGELPSPGAYRILAPQQLAFVSYPYEWCFGQLRDAALCTLEVQRRALARRMTLKDATAFNVQFLHGRPLLIDTLSFERYREGSPWVAYRQFCEHFLAPLFLMARVHPDAGRLFRPYLDGVPLTVAGRLLGIRALLAPGALLHLHLHATSVTCFADSDIAGRPRAMRVSRSGVLVARL